MGTWGTKLYENDLALDLKEEYIEKLKKGIENKEALEQIKQEYKEEIEDNDEETVFWMVLADTMWNLGKMTDEVKNKALQSIEKDLKKWKQESENSKDIVKREKELEKRKILWKKSQIKSSDQVIVLSFVSCWNDMIHM